MKRLLVITFLFLFFNNLNAQNNTLSKTEIEEYTKQINTMVNYLEETFSFIGDPENSAQEKDIIFRDSYTKIFKDEDVQIEDDLDENRRTYINKNVQAYLKDIDFFFKDIKFTFNIDDITTQINEEGNTFFKVTITRQIAGHNVMGDTVNNSLKRYIEINVDPFKKDLKIASIYSTKLNEKEELRVWWNKMPTVWKMYFGEEQYVFDTLEMQDVAHIFRDSIVVVNDSLIENTIACDMDVIYNKLSSFTKTTSVDVSNKSYIHNLEPLYELDNLQSLNCSNTDIFDVYPIRNMNKLKKLDISNTSIEDISNLRYTTAITEFDASGTKINDISVLGLYSQLTNLSLSGTDIEDITPLSNCSTLTNLDISDTKVNSIDSITLPSTLRYLNISNTGISRIETIENLDNLHVLIIDNTGVTDISPISKLIKLNELQCRNTQINDITPLQDLKQLVRIYCDNTGIDSKKAEEFSKTNKNTLVIYKTNALQEWWNGLPIYWKTAFSKQNNTSINPSPEELHTIINMKSLTVDTFFQDAYPIERLTALERLNIESSKIVDLSPLHGLNNLKYLNLKNTKVISLAPLSELYKLQEINIENTPISDLSPLHTLSELTLVRADNSKVDSEQVFNLRVAQPKVTVIYKTKELTEWWYTLDSNWKDVFKQYVTIDSEPKADQLHAVINLEHIDIDSKIYIASLEPLAEFDFLRVLIINENQITDLSSLSNMRLLKELEVSGNDISDLTPLTDIQTLEILNIANTRVTDLSPLEGKTKLRILNISNTTIKNIKALSNCTSLQEINISNTNVKTLAPIENIITLKHVKALNSRVKSKEIANIRAKRPDLNIHYF
ncbi:MAG: leucine-rich repeat domain-containing protein [Candidatus Limimorpha sp.]